MNTYENYKNRLLKDTGFRELYDKECAIHDLAVKIKNIRVQKGWTQTDLAKKMNTNQSSIARWEKGNDSLSIATLSKFCEVTGMYLEIINNPHIQNDGFFNVFDIATFFVLKVKSEAGDLMTNMKLQKLIYYAKAWYLAKFHHPLFKNKIEAWIHGPVVRELYNNLKQAGNSPITPIQVGGNIKNIDQHTSDFLDIIWDTYGKYEAWFLRKLTHSEKPWQKARKNCKEDEPSKAFIEETFLEKYYKGEIGSFQN